MTKKIDLDIVGSSVQFFIRTASHGLGPAEYISFDHISQYVKDEMIRHDASSALTQDEIQSAVRAYLDSSELYEFYENGVRHKLKN